MSEALPNTPEKNEVIDDNARKFTLDGIDPAFLAAHGVSSSDLTTDWLVTDPDSEEKVVHKVLASGETQLWHIKKVMSPDGKRTSDKKRIDNDEEEYEALKARSILQIAKSRHEFPFEQNGVNFKLIYDEFTDSPLRVLEVDADDDDTRASFDPGQFPVPLHEQTGNLSFYGYRVASQV